jgi:hypothetical protein
MFLIKKNICSFNNIKKKVEVSSKVLSSMILLDDKYVSKCFERRNNLFSVIYIISIHICISIDILFIFSRISCFISCALLLFNAGG